MKRVITYGTYDMLHYGHIRLLERAKSLGDYLLVGVTADGFDLTRGKINVRQSLMERIDAVKKTGLADQIIVEEYEGQKIDDIIRYGIDIFTVGSDWRGKFDYLKKYCEVIYLDRTEGISSTKIRSECNEIKLGVVGESPLINKFVRECNFVNGIKIVGICSQDLTKLDDYVNNLDVVTDNIDDLLKKCDAFYVVSHPKMHYEVICHLLSKGKHVLCESPVSLSVKEYRDLVQLARKHNLILMDGIKTAYATAYSRLILLVKSGIIGDVVSIDSTCTSMEKFWLYGSRESQYLWNSITEWAPTALLPIFDLLGCDYENKQIITKLIVPNSEFDLFTNVRFTYPQAVASIKIGQGVKSEGELIISGTKGYVYVPAPWWKTDYFEVRYEDHSKNRRFFYQLDGEGIRYEILNFIKNIGGKIAFSNIVPATSEGIIGIIEDFYSHKFITI